MIVSFDVASFVAALDRERKRRQLTWANVAKEATVSPSTLTRCRQGKRPDVDSMAKLVTWAGVRADDFIRGSMSGPQGTSSSILDWPGWLRQMVSTDHGFREVCDILDAAHEAKDVLRKAGYGVTGRNLLLTARDVAGERQAEIETALDLLRRMGIVAPSDSMLDRILGRKLKVHPSDGDWREDRDAALERAFGPTEREDDESN